MLFSSSYSLIFSQCFQITCTRLGQHSCECRMKATIEESSVQRRSGGVRTPWQHTTLLIVFTRERRPPTIITTCILKKKKNEETEGKRPYQKRIKMPWLDVLPRFASLLSLCVSLFSRSRDKASHFTQLKQTSVTTTTRETMPAHMYTQMSADNVKKKKKLHLGNQFSIKRIAFQTSCVRVCAWTRRVRCTEPSKKKREQQQHPQQHKKKAHIPYSAFN